MNAREFLEILHVAERLKDTPRHCTTSKRRIESVAEHSWRVSLMAFLLKDEFPEVDTDKVVCMCLIHDLEECFTGDIPTFIKTDGDRKTEDSVKISPELLEKLGVSHEELKKQAFDNMKKDHYHIESLEHVLYRLIDREEPTLDFEESDFEPGGMYVMTNRSGYHGAAAILYLELFKKLGSDMYIIPSSIHELLILPADERVDVNELSDMIKTVNETTLSETDILSDHPYYYDCRKMEVLCA